MKKGQIIGQVFIYVITILVFGIVLLYGYKAIGSMSKKADQVMLIQLKKDIADAVEKTDYGSVLKYELTLPGKYNEVCFIDLPDDANIVMNSDYPLVYDSWIDKVSANMFLIQDKGTIESSYIGNIIIDDPNYFCTKGIQGKLSVRLEGKGTKVRLSPWAD
jgi:hypothetical protein